MKGSRIDRHSEPARPLDETARITLLGLGELRPVPQPANDVTEDSGVHTIPGLLHRKWFVRDGGMRL